MPLNLVDDAGIFGAGYKSTSTSPTVAGRQVNRLGLVDDAGVYTNEPKKSPIGNVLTKFDDAMSYVAPQWLSGKEYKDGEQNLWGDALNRPGAAIRSGIMEKAKGGSFVEGYKAGAAQPNRVPRFQQKLLDKYYETGDVKFLKILKGLGVSLAGLALDTVTNPAEVLIMGAGIKPGVRGALAAEKGFARGAETAVDVAASVPGKAAATAGKAAVNAGEPLGRVITAPVKAIKQAPENVRRVFKPVEFAREVRSSVFNLKSRLGKQVDAGVTQLSEANPTKTVDLSDQFFQIKGAIKNAEENPGLASDINATLRKIKDPRTANLVRQMLIDPRKAEKLTLRQAEDIKRAIQSAPSISAKSAQGKFANWTKGDTELLDLIDEIKLAQSEVFPELAQVRAPYAEYMQNYRVVKNMFKERSLLNNMRGRFGNEEIEGMVQKVLPPETYKKMIGFRNTGKALRWGGGVVGVGASAAIVNQILRKTFGGGRY
jgi:hypothetical protein